MQRNRGIYRELDAFAAIVVLKVYNCAGRLIERTEIAADCLTDAKFIELEDELERMCPEDHAPGRCPSAPVDAVERTVSVSGRPMLVLVS